MKALHPQARAALERFQLEGPVDLDTLDPALLRLGFKAMSGTQPKEPVHQAEDRKLPGPAGELGVRIFRPSAETGHGAVVYFHGGGWVTGDLDSHDPTCRLLAKSAGCTVISVDYRLAPEARFPAAPEDCYAATAWIARHGAELGIDGSRLAVAGDSAGGNLAAVVPLMARERGGPALRFQLLVYPVIAHDFETASYREDAEGYLLSRSLMMWFWRQYLAEPADAKHPFASPLQASDLRGLPPARVITAGFDPLRDEGEAYARRLSDAGVPTSLQRHDDMFHGFFSFFDSIDAGRRAVIDAGAALRAALAP